MNLASGSDVFLGTVDVCHRTDLRIVHGLVIVIEVFMDSNRLVVFRSILHLDLVALNETFGTDLEGDGLGLLVAVGCCDLD